MVCFFLPARPVYWWDREIEVVLIESFISSRLDRRFGMWFYQNSLRLYGRVVPRTLTAKAQLHHFTLSLLNLDFV